MLKTAVKRILMRPTVRGRLLSAMDANPRVTLSDSLVKQYCRGNGLEIGPGKHPYCSRANTRYVDRFTDNKDGTPAPDLVADAASIPLADACADFLLSAHTLEHHQNTLKTLYEWTRLLKPGGVLFLILPHADRTLDRFRPRTTVAHHVRDFETLTDAYDSSHEAEIRDGWGRLPDIREVTAMFQQEWGFDMWDFERRNANGVIHFHVWTQHEMIDVVKHVGLTVLYAVDLLPERPDSFVVIGRKSD